MAQEGRPRITGGEKEELWRRWRAGESISDIGRAISKPPGSVFTVLKHDGGIAPAPSKASALRLGPEEREEISRGLVSGDTFSAIAARIGRPTSTVSREVARNGGRKDYRATTASQRAKKQARRPKISALQKNPNLRMVVTEMLGQEWSPEQIVGRLRRFYPDDESMRVSHESIYRAIYTTRWKVIPRLMCLKLRTGRPIRKNKKNTVKGQWRSQITGARPITDRPQEAELRQFSGHLEGDLVLGSKSSQIATLVDRATRFVTLVALPSRHTRVVIPALVHAFSSINPGLRKTLTWDRGMELAAHVDFSRATGIDVFFAAPRSPWQRGTNENTNKLIRQYLPKKTDLSAHTQADLDAIAARLNNRPRKCLDYLTPAEALALTL